MQIKEIIETQTGAVLKQERAKKNLPQIYLYVRLRRKFCANLNRIRVA